MDSPFAVIEQDRNVLADVLDGLSPGQWQVPSLCGHWTVKQVAAHLLVGPTASVREFALAMAKAKGSFHTANQKMVDNRSALTTQQIIDTMRATAGSRFTPPGLDWHAPLSDVRIHALDVTIPLGVDIEFSPEPWREVLTFLLSRKAEGGFVRKRRPALAVHATDIDFHSGDGPRIAGSSAHLALALTGRSAGLDGITGEGVESLREWMATPDR